MPTPASKSLGAHPPLEEIRDYYLRPEILAEFARLTRLREVELIYVTDLDREIHVALAPQSAEQLRVVFQRLFDPLTKLSTAYYPWLHTWSNRAYEVGDATGERRFIGFDSGRELDHWWTRSFSDLYPAMSVLDDLGIHYRLKFSGHRSLHLRIPAEAVPEQYRGDDDWESWGRWRSAVNTVGGYVHRLGAGDELWSRMAGAEPFTGVYSVHREHGLASVPMLPSECREFRPWMASVNLSAPLPGWWDIPVDAQDNFARAVDRIRTGTVVVDVSVPPAQSKQTPGYVASATARAEQQTIPYRESLAGLEAGKSAQSRIATWVSMVLCSPISDEALLGSLRNDDDEIRWFALETRLRSSSGGPLSPPLQSTLQRLVAERHSYVREAAVELLASSGEQGWSVILELAGHKRQWKRDGRGPFRRRRRLDELWALQQSVRESSTPIAHFLVDLAGRSSTEVLRGVCAVLEGCGEVGFQALVDLASNPQADVRREAVITLMYNAARTVPFLKQAASRTTGDNRSRLRRTIDTSDRLLAGDHLCWTMRPATLATVVDLGNEEATKQLGEVLLSGLPREIYHASRGLVLAGPAAVPVLCRGLRSRSRLVRRRASEALRDLADRGSRPQLRAALNDADVGVRLNAVRALEGMAHPQDVGTLMHQTNDPSPAVRRAVREALDHLSAAQLPGNA